MGILNYVKPTEEKRYAKAVGFILNYMELDIAEMRLSAWSFPFLSVQAEIHLQNIQHIDKPHV